MTRRPTVFLVCFVVLSALACASGEPTPPADPAPAASAASGDVCGDPSTVLFSCPVQGGKIVTVCGSNEDDPWLRYRFGPPGAPELVFPDAQEGSFMAFKLETRTFARAMGEVLSFEREGHTYEITEMVGGGGPDGEMNNFAGVTVHVAGAQIAALACTEPPTTRWPALHAILNPVSP